MSSFIAHRLRRFPVRMEWKADDSRFGLGSVGGDFTKFGISSKACTMTLT